ncbi:uncharacterized protein LOC117299647 [Asterias rubens]|uniref:uncharacterized protein LOC117299647 n=1 Tax=Asterias rubens TaxID=7604 RepID=UPI001455B1A0|nr:uncharacterized protein LOC117299647 [Asterias rubens]
MDRAASVVCFLLAWGAIAHLAKSDYCGSSNVLVGTAPVNLTSPGYPGVYPNSVDCQWEIRAPDWLYVVVSIQDLYTEEGYDFVYINGTLLDGHTASIELNGITQLKSIAFTSLTTTYIRFAADDIVSERGFLLQLQGTNNYTSSCHLEDDLDCRNGICVAAQARCDGNLDCRFGPEDYSYVDEEDCDYCGSLNISVGTSPVNLKSPGYPGVYPNSINCHWEIRAPDWVSVVVSIQDFYTQESYDFVYIDGTLLDGHTASIKLNGITQLKSIAITSLTTTYIRFAADDTVSERGFLLQLQGTNNCNTTDFNRNITIYLSKNTTSCHLEDNFDCRNGVCVSRQARCDGQPDCQFSPTHSSSADEEDCGACGITKVHVGSEPINFNLTSYPTGYPPSLDCNWNIIAPDFMSLVHVGISDFSTEYLKDVAVLKGINIYGETVSFVMTGSIDKLISITLNSSEEVSFSFKSDSYVSGPGFLLELYSSNGTVNISCPGTDVFDCEDGSCLNSSGRCDGFRDCQISRKDEVDCATVTCPGSFKCKDSSTCIHMSAVCDDKFDCPDEDDETQAACDDRCPTMCSCIVSDDGYVSQCNSGWNQGTVGDIGIRTTHLKLANENIIQLNTGIFKSLSFLESLVLTNNSLRDFNAGTFSGLFNLTSLDLSQNNISRLQSNIFEDLLNLRTLLVMDNPLLSIDSGAFNSLSNLRELFLIRGKWNNERSTMNIAPGALQGLHSLEILYVDDYRLCCRFDEEVPSKEFDYSKCTTTELQPPLNICGSLMRNDPLRASLWILGLSALIGNLVVIIWRCRRGKELGENETHSFLVLNLAISDLMMGVYMLIIAIADIRLGKSYSSVAKEWRSNVVCKIAGVVSVMSSEASVFFVTLISLDCLLSIVFPFSRVTIRGKISKVIVVILWLVSACVSIIPTVFSGDSDSNVYGLSDVCIGLPLITKVLSSYSFVDNSISSVFGADSIAIPVPDAREPAWIYSIVLFLGVNLFCFIVVLSCYIAIFVKVKRSSRLVKVTARRQREVKMAIKMALIVGTDFACWMPVIIMGILSQAEIVEIGPDMYAWIVVFILPINSSLNPYLYTFYSKITGQSNTKKPEPKVEMKITKSTETLETRASENSQ